MDRNARVLEDGAALETGEATSGADASEPQAPRGPSAISPPSPSMSIVVEPLVRRSPGPRAPGAPRVREERPTPDD